MNAKIEILSTQLLDENRDLVQELKHIANQLGLEFGWHYLLDLIWIINQLGPVDRHSIIDAGAGVGVMQWYLAEKGASVTSVDRDSRANLAVRFRARYQVRGLNSSDLNATKSVLQTQFSEGRYWSFFRSLGGSLIGGITTKAPGSVTIYHQDLQDLKDIPQASFDAVVAVSALEHNPPNNLKLVVQELMRTIKPGGKLLATLCAGRDRDWFHEPSQGWCYTASSLKSAFELPPNTPDNYNQYDELFSSLINNTELRGNLASFYAKSDRNGMPWGKWDPKYQPVGVLKVKE